MLIKEALDKKVRSRHVDIFIKRLKHKDGLMYKDLYVDYCKVCKDECIEPILYNSMYGMIVLAVEKGSIIRERTIIPGIGNATRLWLVR